MYIGRKQGKVKKIRRYDEEREGERKREERDKRDGKPAGERE